MYHVYVLARLEGREREDTVFWHYFVLFLKSLLNARANAGMDINISLRNGMFASRDAMHSVFTRNLSVRCRWMCVVLLKESDIEAFLAHW